MRLPLLMGSIVLLVAIYAGTLARVIRDWLTYQGSFGVVIFGVSLYMIWVKRHALREIPYVSAGVGGALLAIAGCAMLLAGKWGNIIFLQETSLAVTLMGLILLTLGKGIGKAVAWPVFYLIFSVPFLQDFLGQETNFFQNTAAVIASNLLSLTGMPVLRQGRVLELPHITLEVARICSGVNHIFALMVFAVPLGYFSGKSNLSRVLLVVYAFFLGIVINGFRIAIIGIWSRYSGSADLHGPLGMFLASFVFFCGMILLVVTATLTGSGAKRGGAPTETGPPGGTVFRSWQESDTRWVMVAIGIMAVALGTLSLYRARPMSLPGEFSRIPQVIGEWRGEDVQRLDIDLENYPADQGLKRIYRRGPGEELLLYVGYFATQPNGRGVINWRFDELHKYSRPILVADGGADSFEANQTYYDNSGSALSAYFWYVIGDRTLAQRNRTKLAVAHQMLTERSSRGAIVMIMSRRGASRDVVPDPEDLRFVNVAAAAINASLAGK